MEIFGKLNCFTMEERSFNLVSSCSQCHRALSDFLVSNSNPGSYSTPKEQYLVKLRLLLDEDTRQMLWEYSLMPRGEKPFLECLCTITKKGFVKLTLKEKRNSLFLSVVMYWMKNIHDFLNDFISSNFVNAAFLDQIITVIKTLNYKLYSSSSKCDN